MAVTRFGASHCMTTHSHHHMATRRARSSEATYQGQQCHTELPERVHEVVERRVAAADILVVVKGFQPFGSDEGRHAVQFTLPRLTWGETLVQHTPSTVIPARATMDSPGLYK